MVVRTGLDLKFYFQDKTPVVWIDAYSGLFTSLRNQQIHLRQFALPDQERVPAYLVVFENLFPAGWEIRLNFFLEHFLASVFGWR